MPIWFTADHQIPGAVLRTAVSDYIDHLPVGKTRGSTVGQGAAIARRGAAIFFGSASLSGRMYRGP